MATLADLKKKVRNTVSRNSQAFLLEESLDKDGPSHAILSIVDANTFKVDGDQTANSEFNVGEMIWVDGNSAADNNRIYEVSGTALDGGGDTNVSVVQTIQETAPATLGTIYTQKDYIWRSVGRFMGASWETSPISSSADQDGRESSELFELTVSFALMQTSNVELSLMEELAMPDPRNYDFYRNGHTIYFSSSNRVTTTQMNDATTTETGVVDFTSLSDQDGIKFDNALLKPSPEIDMSGEESSIGLEFTGTVELTELSDLDTTQTISISLE